MPCLSEKERLRAIGMLETGMPQNVVARRFGVHRNTIQSLWRHYQQNGNIRDRPCSGRPRVTSRRQDNNIPLVHLIRNQFQTALARTLNKFPIPALTSCVGVAT